MRSKLSKWTIRVLTDTSLPYSTFEVLNSYPLHTAKSPQYAENSLQVAKLATKQKPFDLPTGDGT